MQLKRLLITFALASFFAGSVIAIAAEESSEQSGEASEAVAESPQQETAQEEAKTSEQSAPADDSAAKETPKEDASAEIAPELAERIAELRQLLSQLDDGEAGEHEFSPHAERLRDPEVIETAIEQLKQGQDICTRCLMVCGGA